MGWRVKVEEGPLFLVVIIDVEDLLPFVLVDCYEFSENIVQIAPTRPAPYAIRLNDDEAIDSAGLRGVGSSANQGTRQTNNARLTVYNDANLTYRARIIANRPRRNGQGILVDYGEEYGVNEHEVTYSTLPR